MCCVYTVIDFISVNIVFDNTRFLTLFREFRYNRRKTEVIKMIEIMPADETEIKVFANGIPDITLIPENLLNCFVSAITDEIKNNR